MNDIDSHERMGEFLVRVGALSEARVAEILRRQKNEPHLRFGEIAIALGYLDFSILLKYIDHVREEHPQIDDS